MSEKDTEMSITDEVKINNTRLSLSKFDYDLYHDEENKVEKIIRVKRFSLPNKGERWKIFEDNKLILILEGAKFNKKEKIFLRGIEGVSFLITQAKNNLPTFKAIKDALKKKLSESLTEKKK